MALGAVLLSLSLAIFGSVLVWAFDSVQAYEAILVYAGLGTLFLMGFALVNGALRDDDT